MNKKITKSLLVLFVFFLSCTLRVYGQVNITGQVQDENQQAVPFATVMLLQPADSALIKGAGTDDNGRYVLPNVPPGRYLLRVTMIGYAAYCSPVITIENGQGDRVQGSIQIRQSAQLLEGVSVVARKLLYEKQADRTVVDVQNSVTAAGGTALQILEKSPGVVVNRQDGTIAMNGKSGVLVMINGKVTRLPAATVAQMLDGMSSSNIKKIELITSPPAKYDAEGDAGIIHIITQESPDQGTSGNVGVTLGYNGAEIGGVNADVNYKNNAFSSFLNYSIRGDATDPVWTNERFNAKDGFVQSTRSINRRNASTLTQNLRGGLTYDLNARTSLNLLVTAFDRKWNTSDQIATSHVRSADTTVFVNGAVSEVDRLQSAAGSLGLSHRFNDADELDLEFNYLYYNKTQPSVYDNTRWVNLEPENEPAHERIQVNTRTPINFLVLKMDYSKRVNPNLVVDAGAKGTLSRFTNDVTVARTTGNLVEVNPAFSGITNLEENIGAVYALLKWKPKDEWSIQGGLRYEYTNSNLRSTAEGASVHRKFGNAFPNLLVERQLRPESKLTLAYSRRITRPSFNDLASSVFFINPTTILTGNLSLRPALSSGLDLGYKFKAWWVSVRYSHSKDAIAPFQPSVDRSTDNLMLRPQNLRYLRTFGFHASRPVKITSWWDLQNNAFVNVDRLESLHLENNVQYHLTSFVYNGVNSFLLPGDFTVEITGNYLSPSLLGATRVRSYGRLDIGLRKQLKNGRGTFTLVGNDLLGTTPRRRISEIPAENIDASLFYDFRLRSVLLTYTRAFGNKKLKNLKIESGAAEEKKRVE